MLTLVLLFYMISLSLEQRGLKLGKTSQPFDDTGTFFANQILGFKKVHRHKLRTKDKVLSENREIVVQGVACVVSKLHN